MQLAYEDWAVVIDAIEGWRRGFQKAEFIAGYCVSTVSWEEPESKGIP